MTSMLAFLVVLAVPVAIGAYKVWKYYQKIGAAEAWAVSELAKPKPDPLAYGVLGGILLDQGKIAEALPFLDKAVVIERAASESAQDHLTFAKAHIQGAQAKLESADKAKALKALDEATKIAAKLAKGRAAATWFGAGLQYKAAGEMEQAKRCFGKAVELQPDDWVDEGEGRRYKKRGIASYYAKVYAGSQMVAQ